MKTAIALLSTLATLGVGGSLELLAQERDTLRPTPYAQRPVFAGSSFVVARYKQNSTASLYLSQRIGAGMIVAGGVANPDGTYRAVVVGPGTGVRLGEHAAATLVLAGARATDGGSLRLYAIPRLTAGPLNIVAFGGAYQHVSGTNRSVVSLDPLTASVTVVGSLRLGVAGVFSAKVSRPPDFGVGPAAQVRLPGGVLAVEMVNYTQPARREWRGTINASL